MNPTKSLICKAKASSNSIRNFRKLLNEHTLEPSISVIIPTLNEEAIIGAMLCRLHEIGISEDIIVVDGGSTDQTISITSTFKSVTIIRSPKQGRAWQMNIGAQHAQNDILLFLHADAYLPEQAAYLINNALQTPNTIAGSFAIQFDLDHPLLNYLARASHWNCVIATYGDQGLFLSRSVFEHINGFQEIPILEDIEIQYRLRKLGQFKKINTPIITSARRFLENGILNQTLLNTLLVIAWYCGVSPIWLKKFYSYSKRRK